MMFQKHGYRFARACFGLVLCGAGEWLEIRAALGVAPWFSLNQGIIRHVPISYGMCSILVSLIIVGIDFLLKGPMGIGTIMDAVIIGLVVDWMDRAFAFSPRGFFLQFLCLLFGMVIIALGQYVYISAYLGCGPRDALLIALSKHAKRLPVGAVSAILLSLVLLTAFLLGAPIGIGTLVCTMFAGFFFQTACRVFGFDPKSVT